MPDASYSLVLLKIAVTSIDDAVFFYEDALGFTPQFAAEEFGWAQLLAGEIPVALYVPGKGGGDGPIGGSVGFHLALPPDRFDALAAKLIARKNVVVDNVIHRGEDNTTFIDVRDPDGNVLKLMRAD